MFRCCRGLLFTSAPHILWIRSLPGFAVNTPFLSFRGFFFRTGSEYPEPILRMEPVEAKPTRKRAQKKVTWRSEWMMPTTQQKVRNTPRLSDSNALNPFTLCWLSYNSKLFLSLSHTFLTFKSRSILFLVTAFPSSQSASHCLLFIPHWLFNASCTGRRFWFIFQFGVCVDLEEGVLPLW